MREILVISGKGGTGKTSLTGAFAQLSSNKVICDLDVDAPDLHILLDPVVEREEDFISGHEAVIDPDKCTACGTCADMCRFEAVRVNGQAYAIDPLRCEGCKVCVAFCPAEAISFPDKNCGKWYISRTRFGPMVHAQLHPGEENSGRLVTLLKQQAKEIAKNNGLELILCDGTPGIGCPVISSLAGTHLAVVVTEPTPSGRHDLERVVQLCEYFRTKVVVIINQFDLNPEEADRIEAYCQAKGFEVVARLPYDAVVTRAMVQRKVITEMPDSPLAKTLGQVWSKIEEIAGLKG
jgi:MinD superfamily P-loop ATPase